MHFYTQLECDSGKLTRRDEDKTNLNSQVSAEIRLQVPSCKMEEMQVLKSLQEQFRHFRKHLFAKSQMSKSISLSCLCIKYEPTTSCLLA